MTLIPAHGDRTDCTIWTRWPERYWERRRPIKYGFFTVRWDREKRLSLRNTDRSTVSVTRRVALHSRLLTSISRRVNESTTLIFTGSGMSLRRLISQAKSTFTRAIFVSSSGQRRFPRLYLLCTPTSLLRC